MLSRDNENESGLRMVSRLGLAAFVAYIATNTFGSTTPSDPDLAAETVLRYSLAPFNKDPTDSRKWCLHIPSDDSQVSRMVLRLAADYPRLMHHAECTLGWLSIGANEYNDLNTGEKMAIVRITHLMVHNDGTANVSIGIQRGGLDGYGRDFVLKRDGEKFVVVTAKVTWIS